MAKAYTIFVSHSWDYVADLMSLRKMLNNRGYFNVEFVETPPHDPINSTNSHYIKTKIKENIRKADVVIGLAGIYATYSEWMTWELDTAIALDRPILGVVPWGQQNVSSVVRNRANMVVRWNTESIVAAIRQLA